MTSQGFIARLKLIIQEKGEDNQSIFAGLIDEEQSQVNKWLNTGREPRERAIANICARLGVNLNWLFTGEGQKYLPATRQVNEGKGTYMTPEMTDREREYTHKLLTIFRKKKESTISMITQSIDTGLEVPDAEQEAKKGRKIA